MSGCVYVVNALTTNYYKIGITIDEIEKRLGGLQTAYPFWNLGIVIVHYCNAHRKLEKTLHKRYADQRLRNSEWFELTDRELAELKISTHNLMERAGVIEEADEPPPETAKTERSQWKKRAITLHDLFPPQQEDVKQIEDEEEIDNRVLPKSKEPSDGKLFLSSRYNAAKKLSAEMARNIESALGKEEYEPEWSQALNDYADALDVYTGEYTYSVVL